MPSPLADRTYCRLFLAQVLSLLGTGLATVALKMVAYVGVAPVASAFVHLVPRRALLIALDLLRAGVALLLPFVTEVWQVHLLVFVGAVADVVGNGGGVASGLFSKP